MMNFTVTPNYFSDLTPREREVLDLIVLGKTNPQIASELTIGRETVKTHVSRILWKLGVSSRQDARLLVSGQGE
jgi:DNA-binding NarL/FixJ family response regulator